MNKIDNVIIKQLYDILTIGTATTGTVRTVWDDGSPAHALFITHQMATYDLQENEYPLSSLRPIVWKKSIAEIMWIYQDQSNSIDLLENKYGVMWWRDWDIGDSTIGQRYGATIKKYDLVNKLLKGLEDAPNGRRHIINMYQYDDLESTEGLHPCAFETHWTVRDGYLDLMLVQRSQDMLIAQSINSIQYVALLMMVAKHLGLRYGKFSHVINNLHIYDRHLENLDDISERIQTLMDNPRPQPQLVLNVASGTNFYDIKLDDFEVIDYKPIRPQLKFEIAK